jgi:hypothetical protein
MLWCYPQPQPASEGWRSLVVALKSNTFHRQAPLKRPEGFPPSWTIKTCFLSLEKAKATHSQEEKNKEAKMI